MGMKFGDFSQNTVFKFGNSLHVYNNIIYLWFMALYIEFFIWHFFSRPPTQAIPSILTATMLVHAYLCKIAPLAVKQKIRSTFEN